MLFAHITKSFRETFPARASEWALAVMLMNWAIVLTLLPNVFEQQAYFAPMNALMKQTSWAYVCLAVSAVRLTVLIVNGMLKRSPHLRALTSFFSALVWFEISIGFLQTGSPTTGLAIYPVLFALDTFNTARAMGDAKLADTRNVRTTEDEPTK